VPTISTPGNLIAEATGPLGAVVSYTVTATDAVNGTDPVTCSPASGTTFRLGHSTVSCSSTNKGGTSNASFDVLVRDTTPPALTVPADITVKVAALASGAKVTFTVTATDLVDPTPTVSCNPASGSLFLIQTTTVTCTATDSSGNSSSKKFTVTVTL
jgi:HYR domain